MGKPRGRRIDYLRQAISFAGILMETRLSGEHSLLFVQNGMGHLKMLEKLKNRDIFVATIEHGALRLAENEVNHTGEGITRIAPFRGNNQRLIEKLISPRNEPFRL